MHVADALPQAYMNVIEDHNSEEMEFGRSHPNCKIRLQES